MILTIPYKRLALCNLEELAAQQQINERRNASTGGVLFAQKHEHAEKDEARKQVLGLALEQLRTDRPLRTLTMPGMNWFFESALLKRIEPAWRHQELATRLDMTCIENDRFVYNSACTKMPGNKTSTLRSLERPPYAECAMGNGMVARYIFGNVDDLLQDDTEPVVDLAWLDYTGPLSVERMQKIRRFWMFGRCRALVVTTLKARWNKETSATIATNGGILGWHRARLPGQVLHEIEYQDGASPMVQFAVGMP